MKRTRLEQRERLTGDNDGSRLGGAVGGGGEAPAKVSLRCRGQRREPIAPTAPTRPGEAPGLLPDDGQTVARRVKGGGGARVSGGDTLKLGGG
jgi:hypothetical protein